MSTLPWEELSGSVLSEGIVLGKVIERTNSSALFRAHSPTEAEPRDAVVLAIKPLEDAQTVLNRFLEASFLEHPNLTRVSSAGILENRGFVYAVTEPFDHTLTQFVSQRPLPEDDALELTEQVVAGLSYLHSENLVFCNLRPESVWRVRSEWKLGDFSQLRVAGRGENRNLRTALARRPDLPPEVYEGVISPSWDVWSLGLLLRRVLLPEPAHVEGSLSVPRARQLRNAELPPPFDTITRDCLEPTVDARITLDELRARLKRPGPRAAAPEKAAAAVRPGLADVNEARAGNFRLGEAKSGVARFFRRLPEQKPVMQAGMALAGAALIMGLLAAANALVKRGDSAPTAAQTSPPIVVSEADRSSTPPAAPAVSDRPQPSQAPPDAAARGDASNVPEDIKALLDKWVTSTRTHDVRANLDCYAPSVDTFYTRQWLSHDQLVRAKQLQFQSIGRVRKYGLENVRVNRISPDKAIVSFDKEWSFGDRNLFEGAERAELTIRNLKGAWKISAEKETHVYWVRRGRA